MREFGSELQKFAEYCGQRAYDAQSGGLHNPTSLRELDKLANKFHVIEESFRVLRDIVAQPNSVMGTEEKPPLPIGNGYMPPHESNGYPDEKPANLYPQPDTKKRRGVR